MSKNKSDSENEGKEKPIIVRNTTDLQRLKLEKLMKNPVSTTDKSQFKRCTYAASFRTNLC